MREGTVLTESDRWSSEALRREVAGVDARVPVYNGQSVRYVNFDNAATTPPFAAVLDSIQEYGQYYSSVHRGTGFKSLLSTHVYEQCRHIMGEFVGADPEYHTVLFTCNATHALNKVARRLAPAPDDAVIITQMEHHSNILPWRQRGCRVLTAKVNDADGTLNVADLETKLRENSGRVKAVSVTGASNVTGNMPPIRRIARMAHEHGAWFVVDGTQLAPHRPIRMGGPDDPERIDFLALSGHKMYAPFGCGLLVAPAAVFQGDPPDVVGGGTVHAVTSDRVVWHDLPEREEPGTPNVIGAMTLARAARRFQEIGMDRIVEHERDLARYCLKRLMEIDGLRIYGQADPEMEADRLGVFAVEARGLSHSLLAAVLGYEWGIGVRNGCFCAQPYVRELLGISAAEMNGIVDKLSAGDHASVPGLVRVSLGIYNTRQEIDYLADALRSILTAGPQARYALDPQYQDYVPEGWDVDYDTYMPM